MRGNRGIEGLPRGDRLRPGRYTVANLPAGREGDLAYATDLRVFNGTGTQESSGAGTGGMVTCTAAGVWRIAGTNVTAVA